MRKCTTQNCHNLRAKTVKMALLAFQLWFMYSTSKYTHIYIETHVFLINSIQGVSVKTELAEVLSFES